MLTRTGGSAVVHTCATAALVLDPHQCRNPILPACTCFCSESVEYDAKSLTTYNAAASCGAKYAWSQLCAHVTCDNHVLVFARWQATAVAHADLSAAAEKLIRLKETGSSKEDIQEQIDLVTQLSAAAGTNKIVSELNNGRFQGYTLTVSGIQTAGRAVGCRSVDV